MKKRRRIILIGIVWLVLVGVLVGLGISRSSDGDSAHEGDRLMTVSGGSAWPEKNDEADAGEADAGENGSESGTDGTGENSSRENSSGDAGPVSTGKDSPGKESSAGSDTGKKAADFTGEAKSKGDSSTGSGKTSTDKTESEKDTSGTDVQRTAKPKPTPKPEKKDTFQFTIRCTRILDRRDLWRDGLEEVVPENGVFFSGKLPYKKGETVYDALKSICEKNDILLDSRYTPLYDTYYVSGIGNLYEFDCGSESGWKYSVNGKLPGVGCSKYTIHKGDTVVFFYDYEI